MKVISKIKLLFRKLRGGFFSCITLIKKRLNLRRSPIYVNSINKTIIGMVNYERKKRGLRPVIFDPSLQRHAIDWSKRMADEGRLFHSGTILENTCMVPARGSPNSIAKRAFYCWKGSALHWNWMMHPNIKRVAFGYWTKHGYAYGAYAFNNP
jgi:uncharacterized protein YkwD